MSEQKQPEADANADLANHEFKKLIEKHAIKIPHAGDTVVGTVLSASKSEVRLDIGGILTGVVRGRELYQEADEYANLKPGADVEATVIDEENENGELELSFRFAGQMRAWADIRSSNKDKGIIKVKITDANKGGLIAHYRQIYGFLPVSQLAPENYPRVNGGDKTKILDRLRSFVGQEFQVKVITLDEKEEKIIFSEKEAWNELQRDIISKYRVGTVVEGEITAITDFGVFISFGENLEGLIHISELAWQRIDDPADLFKVGEKIKAEIINIDGSKIFLSAKKLIRDPWHDVTEKYQVGQAVPGMVLKINPFGLFVKLDEEIHGLAHVSQLNLAPGQKITDAYKPGEKMTFKIMSIEPKEHRLGLAAQKDAPAEDGRERASIPVASAKAVEPEKKKAPAPAAAEVPAPAKKPKAEKGAVKAEAKTKAGGEKEAKKKPAAKSAKTKK